MIKKYSQKTIPRALLYIRTLENMIKEKRDYVSSKDLAEITGLTDVQIRKDISNFKKKVGKPRVGYQTNLLKSVLEEFVQQNTVHVSLFGVGNLGKAIMKYPEFHTEKIELVNAFDNDKKKVGKIVNGIKVYPISEAPRIIPKSHAEIGIIATPKESSQEIANMMVVCGLKGIVNFSPTSVYVPEGVVVKNIDLSIEFLSLFCDIQN